MSKVVHLITRLDPGGSAENTLLTCQHLAASGWRTTLASGPGWTGETASAGDDEVPIVLIPSLRRDPAPIADAIAFMQIYRLLRRERPSILHTHSAKAGVLGRWAGRAARVPVLVHTPHGHVLYGYARGFKNWLYLTAERLCAPLSHCLVALSEGEKRESAAAGIGKLAKWTVVPSGVDVSRITPREAAGRGGTVRIGTVARLEHVKGIDVLVRAAGRLPRTDDLEVLVWGDGREERKLRALASDTGVEGRVTFVGTDEPVEDFLRSLDIYVQPSRNEGMGRALVLAQAVGLPVVASRVCGIPDVVRDGETGTLVPPEDPEALAQAIAALVRDPAARIRQGDAAREWILSSDETGRPRFSTEAMLWRLDRLYRNLTSAGGQGEHP